MDNQLPKSKKKIYALQLSILLSLILVGCNTHPILPLKVDPCTVLPDKVTCLAVPLNQVTTPYERLIYPGDITFKPDDYAQIQKKYREILRLCGERCK